MRIFSDNLIMQTSRNSYAFWLLWCRLSDFVNIDILSKLFKTLFIERVFTYKRSMHVSMQDNEHWIERGFDNNFIGIITKFTCKNSDHKYQDILYVIKITATTF